MHARVSVTCVVSGPSTQGTLGARRVRCTVCPETSLGFPPQPQMTAPTPQSKAEATLRALRVRYRSESWQTVNLFRRLATELQATPELADALQRLRKEAHRVHGTAGSYGFRRASALAEVLEERALRWIADPALDRERRGALVEEFTRELERSFAEEA